MKKSIIIALSVLGMFLSVSCQKTVVNAGPEAGYLSLGGFSLEIDEDLDTRASAASGNYVISILDAEGNEYVRKSYSEVRNNDDKISLPAGNYTLIARSSDDEVPYAAFEQPIYGVSKEFSIEAGEVTEIGELTCTLLQCKVTVEYSDEFLADVIGEGSTKVTVTSGYPLTYALGADGSYDLSSGYFAVNGNTMVVVFSGNIGGKMQKMTKSFTGIAPKQWRKIKFIKKKDEQGQATFDIVIQDLIDDEVLNNTLDVSEEILGDDPDAPKGDGGITLGFDYEAGCDEELTDLNNMVIVPVETREMCIKLKATVPNGILKFNVDIQSDSEDFNATLSAVGGSNIDLINPSEANEGIFSVVPFPHGQELVGDTEVDFDLSVAQGAIIMFKGTHTFMMTIVDQTFCTKKIPVTMVVE